MTFVRKVTTNAAIGIGIADDPSSLNILSKPGCAAAIWRRQTPPSIQSWLDGHVPEILPRGRVAVPTHMVGPAVRHFCDMSGLPDGAERDWFQSDITSLADMFSNLMSVRVLRLRLDVITHNACRKFHVDAITARLICTYRGTGTQYGVSTNGTDPNRVFTVPTGAPIVLRGSRWLEQPPTGLLHRSPPIEGTGETRLVLVVDPVFDGDADI